LLLKAYFAFAGTLVSAKDMVETAAIESESDDALPSKQKRKAAQLFTEDSGESATLGCAGQRKLSKPKNLSAGIPVQCCCILK